MVNDQIVNYEQIICKLKKKTYNNNKIIFKLNSVFFETSSAFLIESDKIKLSVKRDWNCCLPKTGAIN